jgi:hypothetical protein
MTAEEFVKKIAEENPIRGTYQDTNECKYCETGWAEDTYEEYLTREKSIDEIRTAADTDEKRVAVARNLWPLVSKHHDDDCLWIEANKIVRKEQ